MGKDDHDAQHGASLLSKGSVRFAWDSLRLIVSGGIAGFLGMLIHFALGRMMDPVEYGLLVSLLGMMILLRVPSNAIRVVMARYVAEYAHGNEENLWVALVRRAAKRISVWGIVGLGIWTLGAYLFRDVLAEYPMRSLVVLGVIGWVSLFTPVMAGTLQGARYFGWLASIQFIGVLSRLTLAVLAVYLGGKATSVLAAFAVAAVIVLVISYYPLRGILRRHPGDEAIDTGPIYRYLWPVLFGNAAVYLLMNADRILYVHFLASPEMEAFGKAAMLSRTALFLPLPVAQAMFPRAVTSARSLVLLGPICFALVCSVAAAAVISIYPGFFLNIMYGIRDPLHEALIQRYVWAVVPICICTILAQYLWARHEARIVLWSVPILIAYLAALFQFHEDPNQIIACLTAGGMAVLIWFSVAVWWVYRKRSVADRDQA